MSFGCHSLVSFPSPQPSVTTNLLPGSRDLSVSINGITSSVASVLVSFTGHNVFEVPPYCGMCQPFITSVISEVVKMDRRPGTEESQRRGGLVSCVLRTTCFLLWVARGAGTLARLENALPGEEAPHSCLSSRSSHALGSRSFHTYWVYLLCKICFLKLFCGPTLLLCSDVPGWRACIYFSKWVSEVRDARTCFLLIPCFRREFPGGLAWSFS